MIKLVKVDKYFNRFKKNQIHVINKTSLDFPSKGLVALLGPSGCGKTTLLNVIGGLDKTSGGQIYINGKKLGKTFDGRIDKIRNINIGYIFQDYNLVDDLTVFQNVELSLKMIGVKDAKERKRRVDYVLEKVGLYRYRNRLATMLSGGERQRVGIARAIVKNPPIIIADEPTGNLDSRNTLEIMNIIKDISEDKLVILVTHEKDIAHFYATRIIELIDGQVVKDYANDHEKELDYRIDQKIYLHDMPVRKSVEFENVKMKYFSDDNDDVEITLVVKKGNIYIQTSGKKKIEAINKQSLVELIEGNYQKLNTNTKSESSFNMNEATEKVYKPRYSSVFNIFTLIAHGFNKIFNYPLIKKILLIGFAVSAMFTVYSFSNVAGILDVKDSEFTLKNKEYLSVDVSSFPVNDYLELEKLDFVKYVVPSDSQIAFSLFFNNYYQTLNISTQINGSLSPKDLIDSKTIIAGNSIAGVKEVVIDKMAIDNMNNGTMFGGGGNMGKQAGLIEYKDYLGITLKNPVLGEYKIVGIVDAGSPSIYVDESQIINLIANNDTQYYMMKDTAKDSGFQPTSVNKVTDYNITNKIRIKKGRLPKNDYEVILNYNHAYEYKLNKLTKIVVNGHRLKLVGFYTSSVDDDSFYVNNNTVKYDVINNAKALSIVVTDKNQAIEQLRFINLNAIDSYQDAKTKYMANSNDKIVSGIMFSGFILAISLIEILLMIRASFLSRIKEVGVYRAIGMKKGEIYKMFGSEILAITTIASLPGALLMYYILSGFEKIPFFGRDYLVNLPILGLALLTILISNIIFGLLPVYMVLRKKPAAILARTDI